MIFFKSALAVLAVVTSTTSALSINSLQSRVRNHKLCTLHLEDPRSGGSNDLEDLQSKRDQLKKASMASVQPQSGPKVGHDIDKMSKDDLQAYMESIGNSEFEDEIESIMAGNLSFKTKRVSPPTGDSKAKGRPSKSLDDEEESFEFIDYDDGSWDENEFHIPNRIGFTTADWANVDKGFVNGKLKKADRKMGKFNKADLKKAYTKLEKSGVTFIETFESLSKSEALVSKINKNVELMFGPDIAATYPNPWKHALRNRSRPRSGADAVCDAAEQACRRLGIDTLTLFQVENTWYYLGGTNALGTGMLEVIQEGHSMRVGCVDMSTKKLYRLQQILTENDEFVATNQFEFSLTNRKNMGMINACKKMGITPICRNVLDGGLATGKFTPTTPTGGRVSSSEGDAKGPYSLRQLEKLNALFQTMDSLTQTVSKRVKSDLLNVNKGPKPDINTKITTTQIAINYVKAKGAVPLLSITNPKEANELLGCLGWELNDDEVAELDKACKVCGL